VNLRHDTAGDLRISLRSPSAADAVFLFNNNVRTRVSVR
jgi:subtilisin-like proprotein convertase family protein